MNKRKTSNSEVRAEQAASIKPQTIKLGLDVHAESIVVVRILDHGGPQPAQKFTQAGFLAWARKQLRLAETVHSCYEAGPLGYVLHRKLAQMGIKNLVVQPVNLDAYGKGVKNDKSDARELALRLDRYVGGNPRALALVRVPTPEEEQKRAASRQREQLRRHLQRVAAQGRGLLLTQGWRERKEWWHLPRWKVLARKLPAWLAERLEVLRRLLAQLEQELDTATGALEAAAPQPLPKGFGSLTDQVIEREVCDWRRFTNRRQVGSYTGLCGGLHASGQSRRALSITKHGNARLRTALVEMAWRLVHWQRDCALVRKWWPIVGNPKAARGARKKAIVAMARQLAVDLWRWRTGRVSAQKLGWVIVEPLAAA